MLKLNNKGITLLEAMITILVIMIGLLSLAKIYPIAFKLNKTSEQATIASNLSQAKIEDLYYLGYDNLTIGTFEAKQRLSADPNDQLYNFQREVLVEYVDSDLQTAITETNLKKITINIFWHNPSLNIEKNTQLISLISNK